MKIPRYLLRTSIVVEPYVGDSAIGPVFSAPHSVRCHWEGKRRLVYDGNGGRDSVSTATIYTNQNDDFPLGSKVTKGSKVYVVVDVLDNDTGLPNAPDHYEILVSPWRDTGGRR